MQANQTIAAVILAGGKATRMGGQDKGLVEVAGQTIAARICNQLSAQVDEIIINANRNLERYQRLGYTVVSDSLTDYQGPLAGMSAALSATKCQWLLTAPCDGPFIAADYCKRMVEQSIENGHLLAVGSDGTRLQPVYALIHRDLSSSLNAYLKGNDRKIDRWYQQHAFSEVSFPDDKMFTNINTPDELKIVEAQLQRASLE